MALQVVGDRLHAAALLHPMRVRVLETLREPGSSSTVARKLSLSRQRVNYHLRALERMGFLELLEERKKGNCTERILRTKARSFVIAPQALGALAASPAHVNDRFSSAYLLAVASQLARDVTSLRESAGAAGKRLATLTLESEIAFASAAARARFAEELSRVVGDLAARYHTEGGRRFRMVVGVHPGTEERP